MMPHLELAGCTIRQTVPHTINPQPAHEARTKSKRIWKNAAILGTLDDGWDGLSACIGTRVPPTRPGNARFGWHIDMQPSGH